MEAWQEVLNHEGEIGMLRLKNINGMILDGVPHLPYRQNDRGSRGIVDISLPEQGGSRERGALAR
jgi:hypothetical protein